MIKIADMSSVSTVKRLRSTKKGTQATGFDSALEETIGVDNIPSISAPSTVSSLTSLMQAQETVGLYSQQKELCHRGVALLDSLGELQSQILVGAHDEETLQRLADLVKDHAQLADHPELSGIVEQIEQRVAIELAKIEMSLKNTKNT